MAFEDINTTARLSDYNLDWRTIDELTARELHAVLKLRSQIFVVEQASPYQDVDDLDLIAEHLLVRRRDDLKLAAYLRMIPPQEAGPVRLGRIVTGPDVRGGGAGRWIVQTALRRASERYPRARVEIAAQSYLENFYSSFGFARISGNYEEDGVEHCDMELKSQLPER